MCGAVVGGAALVFLGCAQILDPDYYLLPRLPELYLYDNFSWSTIDDEVQDEESLWIKGATDGQPESAEVHRGNFISIGYRNFLRSTVELRGDTRITVEYQVYQGEDPPEENGDLFDYRIVLSPSSSSTTELEGPAVELAFWADTDFDTNPDSDEIRIRNATDATDTVGLTSAPYTDPLIRTGTIEIDVIQESGFISARLFSGSTTAIMEATGTVGTLEEPYFLAIQASGNTAYLLRARAVDTVSVVALEDQ